MFEVLLPLVLYHLYWEKKCGVLYYLDIKTRRHYLSCMSSLYLCNMQNFWHMRKHKSSYIHTAISPFFKTVILNILGWIYHHKIFEFHPHLFISRCFFVLFCFAFSWNAFVNNYIIHSFHFKASNRRKKYKKKTVLRYSCKICLKGNILDYIQWWFFFVMQEMLLCHVLKSETQKQII